MERRTGVVTAVGRTHDGLVWCELDQPFFRRGDTGRVGPFPLLGLSTNGTAGLSRCLLSGDADPRVGEVLGLVRVAKPERQPAPYAPVRRPVSKCHDGSQAPHGTHRS